MPISIRKETLIAFESQSKFTGKNEKLIMFPLKIAKVKRFLITFQVQG